MRGSAATLDPMRARPGTMASRRRHAAASTFPDRRSHACLCDCRGGKRSDRGEGGESTSHGAHVRAPHRRAQWAAGPTERLARACPCLASISFVVGSRGLSDPPRQSVHCSAAGDAVSTSRGSLRPNRRSRKSLAVWLAADGCSARSGGGPNPVRIAHAAIRRDTLRRSCRNAPKLDSAQPR
jgi:hypothetical protein